MPKRMPIVIQIIDSKYVAEIVLEHARIIAQNAQMTKKIAISAFAVHQRKEIAYLFISMIATKKIAKFVQVC